MSSSYDKGVEALYQGDLPKAEEQLTKAIKADSQNADAYFYRGKARWQGGKQTDAMSDFHNTLAVKPNHNQAKVMLEMANQIMGFRNPDMYNP
ncbi:MAG TPA: tetratricopeptide repeat protein [Perlabentimonas sp.]|nr:tetratricopeptide repeat protein [Perlabentimonas sp.]